jgi:hypothetical protein
MPNGTDTAAPAVPAQRNKRGRKIYPAQHNVVGRPTLYRPEYCNKAISLGKLGKSPAQIAAAFDVDRATLTGWAGQRPEFAAALARAKTYEQQWWEDHAQKNLKAKHYQSQVWRTSMAARFRDEYTERTETAHTLNLATLIEGLHGGAAKVIEGQATTIPATPEPDDKGE